ncbi:uncharacterized protein LOC113147102 [Cyclospora cayetanensis]|uniref:Uncharacterized protein LOC113147102 n=1 Tax=Cyclospora cayetanensis TaxID=88456 RepID=A0A6P6RWG1_9EIME|nr:uncharacterized protein LOC113147102 [Cyclospora cayetanensis]
MLQLDLQARPQEGEALQPQQLHRLNGEAGGQGTPALAKAGTAVEGHLQQIVRELLQEQGRADISLLAESLTCLDTHGWRQHPPAAGASARLPTTVGLSLFVRRQRLETYRQQLHAFRRVFPLLQQLQQAAESLNSTLATALGRLAKSRLHLLPLLQQLLKLRQEQQQLSNKEATCTAILERLSVPPQALEALTRPLPPQESASLPAARAPDGRKPQEVHAVSRELHTTVDALATVQQRRHLLQKLAAAASADFPLIESLLLQTRELSDLGQERLFLLVLHRLQQLGPFSRDTVLWEALTNLHGYPAYLLQCLQQLLRLRRHLLRQGFERAAWTPRDAVVGSRDTPRPLRSSVEWLSHAAAEEAEIFVAVLDLLFAKGGAAALGIAELQQGRRANVAAESPVESMGAPMSSAASHVNRASAEEAAEGGPFLEELPTLVEQQVQQQQQEEDPERHEPTKGWLPMSDAPTLPAEAGGSAATLQQLLDPVALLDGALEVLHAPLTALVTTALESNSSKKSGDGGISALKVALLLQGEAAAIEEAVAASLRISPQQRLETNQQQNQPPRKLLLVSHVLDLHEKAIEVFEAQWDSSALQLPQLSPATAARWNPCGENEEARRSSGTPSFLSRFAARLQDMLLTHASFLPSVVTQQEAQQMQMRETSLQRLEALVGRDVPRCVNFCLQLGHLMGGIGGCVYILNALCSLRTVLQSEVLSLPPQLQQAQQEQQQQQKQFQEILALPLLQQQRRLLTELIDEKSQELGQMEGARLRTKCGLTLMLEAVDAYGRPPSPEDHPAPEFVSHGPLGTPQDAPTTGSGMSKDIAAELLTAEKVEDFLAALMTQVYGDTALEMPLLGALAQGALRRKVRAAALEALVDGYSKLYTFIISEGRGSPTHTPEQIKLLLDL